ncbi:MULTISPECIES: hypothetical protein [Clostridia]|jgi:hypothetical protein|nr:MULTISPECIES: hypothetical protein [Clostridia]
MKKIFSREEYVIRLCKNKIEIMNATKKGRKQYAGYERAPGILG